MENDRINIKNVPKSVLIEVREKWTNALIDGWDEYKLWVECAMCEYMDSKIDNLYERCEMCPLSPEWCNNGNIDTSKISGEYCSIIDKCNFDYMCEDCIEYNSNIIQWDVRVKAFIEYLDNYIMEPK